jgi:methylated-DNA-protein-cysteine methyltransferase-like protein
MTPKFAAIPDREAYYAQVWDLVRQVPPGQVVTYGQVATLVNPPSGMATRSYRAFGPRWVGSAMARCPADVPWHRVVNAQGKISLRRSGGGGEQRARLEAEGIIFDESGRISLDQYRWHGPEKMS